MLKRISIAVALLAGVHSVGFDALAQENQQFVVRPKVYERLAKAQKAISERKYQQAHKELEIIQKRMRPNDHEKALTYQASGFAYAGQEKLKPAVAAMQSAWDLNALPAATQNSLLFTIGQVWMAQEQYKKAVVALDKWIAVTEAPTSDALYTVAAAKYQAKDMAGAAKFAERAVKSAKKVKDSWLQLLLSAYIDLKRWRPAIGVMQRLIERNPDKRSYWIQLTALYSEVNDSKRALAVMKLAYDAGVLEKREDYVQLAQRYQAEDIPLTAAEVLLDASSKKKVQQDAEVSKIIAESLFVARDDKRAAPALAKAARVAKNGEMYMRLAQLQIENEEWAKAVEASQKAISKGGLKSNGQAHLLIGIAESRRGRSAAAKQAFTKAAKSSDTKRSAEGWLKFLANQAAAAAAAAQ
ncbi:MAG: hypothetical protein AAFZ18_06045 [Myxococcota bacterium]